MGKLEEAESDGKALRARLEKLSSALEAQRNGTQERLGGDAQELIGKGSGQALNLGFRVLTEFAAGIIVGAGTGWLLDTWLGTSPILLIIFLMLGTAAGFWNVYRIATAPSARDRRGNNGT